MLCYRRISAGVYYALPISVRTISSTLRVTISATTIMKITCLTVPSAHLPMSSLSCVYRISGITANGMPMESTTWPMTSA